MKSKIYIGKNEQNKDVFVDLEKEGLHSIILTGETGSGKSVFHYHLYKELIDQTSPDELGIVFLDMTRVDFAGWESPYLLYPTIVDLNEALDAFEKLGEESILRSHGKSDSKRAIVIHIEECDMIANYPERFEHAWLNITNHKDTNNMYVIFSTSRPSTDVLTKTLLKTTDLKVVFKLASVVDSRYVLGESLAEKFTSPGQKVLAFRGKKILCQGFSDNEARKFEEYFGF